MRRRGRPGRAAARPWRWSRASCLPPSPGAAGTGPGRRDQPDLASRPRSPSNRAAATLSPACAKAGSVIFIRHAATAATQDDPGPTSPTPAPSGTSPTTDASRPGSSAARSAASGFRWARCWPAHRARTRETAELAFGRDRVRVTQDLLNEAFPSTDDEELAGRLRRLFATRPPAGQNTVLVFPRLQPPGSDGALDWGGRVRGLHPRRRRPRQRGRQDHRQGMADAGPAGLEDRGRRRTSAVARPVGRSAAHSTKPVVARARKATRPRSKRVPASQTVLAPHLGTPGSWRRAPPGLTVVLVCPITAPPLRRYRGLVAAGRLNGRLAPSGGPARPCWSRWVRAV